ncbi:MAG TPA: hypothetical protein VKG79_17240 [Bryobacteraceae bacterium]|nr:hypothetical protein [Bryobacteraceae bacterium]
MRHLTSEEFRAALGEFRGAVRAWSEDQAQGVIAMDSATRERRSWTASRQFALALVLAAVCILASFVVPRHTRDKAPANDAVLLNQVDVQVSRTAPSSLEPLMKLLVQE